MLDTSTPTSWGTSSQVRTDHSLGLLHPMEASTCATLLQTRGHTLVKLNKNSEESKCLISVTIPPIADSLYSSPFTASFTRDASASTLLGRRRALHEKHPGRRSLPFLLGGLNYPAVLISDDEPHLLFSLLKKNPSESSLRRTPAGGLFHVFL